MKELRAFALVLMGIVCGLVWGGGCYGPTGSFARPLQAAPTLAMLAYDVPDGTPGGLNAASLGQPAR